jgi:hypothetical protein
MGHERANPLGAHRPPAADRPADGRVTERFAHGHEG